MFKGVEPASSCWEVERRVTGNMLKPYCVVILRSRKDSSISIVKATSSDFQSMRSCAEDLIKDLHQLTNDEFTAKHCVPSPA